MPATDKLYRGIAHGGQFRIFAVESTHTAQAMRDLHDLSPIATLLLGKMVSAAAMLSLDLKTPGSEVSLRLEGDGPLKGALVICDDTGNLRGYPFEPRLWLEEAQENFYPVKHLGNGSLSVIRTAPGKRPTSGYTALAEGEVAQNMAHYYEQSEQVPTAVNLGVLIDRDASVKAAGGFVIQQMPGADPLLADSIIASLAKTPNVSDLMDMGLTLPAILSRFVFPDGELELAETHGLRFRCNCTRYRFARALALLGEEDLRDLREGIDPQCHFCNQRYHFSGEEIDQLLSARKETP